MIEIQEQVLVGGDEVIVVLTHYIDTNTYDPKSCTNSLFQDSDWEEVQEADVETDEALILSSSAIPRGRPSHDYLDAMAKAFDEVYQRFSSLFLICHPVKVITS